MNSNEQNSSPRLSYKINEAAKIIGVSPASVYLDKLAYLLSKVLDATLTLVHSNGQALGL